MARDPFRAAAAARARSRWPVKSLANPFDVSESSSDERHFRVQVNKRIVRPLGVGSLSRRANGRDASARESERATARSCQRQLTTTATNWFAGSSAGQVEFGIAAPVDAANEPRLQSVMEGKFMRRRSRESETNGRRRSQWPSCRRHPRAGHTDDAAAERVALAAAGATIWRRERAPCKRYSKQEQTTAAVRVPTGRRCHRAVWRAGGRAARAHGHARDAARASSACATSSNWRAGAISRGGRRSARTSRPAAGNIYLAERGRVRLATAFGEQVSRRNTITAPPAAELAGEWKVATPTCCRRLFQASERATGLQVASLVSRIWRGARTQAPSERSRRCLQEARRDARLARRARARFGLVALMRTASARNRLVFARSLAGQLDGHR